MAGPDQPEPFPALAPIASSRSNTNANPLGVNTAANTDNDQQHRSPTTPNRSNTVTSVDPTSSPTRSRAASVRKSFLNSNPPLGMWQATGEVSSKVPTLNEIRNGSFTTDGWSHEGQMEKRGTNPHEIHRRRLARTSSASTKPRRSSNANASLDPTTPTVDEEEESRQYFPRRGSLAAHDEKEEAGAVTTNVLEQERSGPNQGVPQDAPTTNGLASKKANMLNSVPSSTADGDASRTNTGPDETGTYPNGYRFPAKHNWTTSTVIGLKAFGRFVITPFGFLITVYGLNVVGWGAMIFFLLLNAAPAMCNPSCSDKHHSARQIWIEVDSQVLNALFCVTAWGLIPWRFRDFYYLMRWRMWKEHEAHRRLAGLYRGWYRLPGSQDLPDYVAPPPVYSKKNPPPPDAPPPYSAEEVSELEANPSIPLPVTSLSEPPLTGIRAQPSRSWTLDFVIWMYMWNTILQCFLAGFMWGYNRFDRPSWAVGLFITLGCGTGIAAGVLVFVEGKKVKKAEGIPIHEYDVLESIEEYQERKGKEDDKLRKKEEKKEHHAVKKTEKTKGHQWYTR